MDFFAEKNCGCSTATVVFLIGAAQQVGHYGHNRALWPRLRRWPGQGRLFMPQSRAKPHAGVANSPALPSRDHMSQSAAGAPRKMLMRSTRSGSSATTRRRAPSVACSGADWFHRAASHAGFFFFRCGAGKHFQLHANVVVMPMAVSYRFRASSRSAVERFQTTVCLHCNLPSCRWSLVDGVETSFPRRPINRRTPCWEGAGAHRTRRWRASRRGWRAYSLIFEDGHVGHARY
jgi:hypothetical protein